MQSAEYRAQGYTVPSWFRLVYRVQEPGYRVQGTACSVQSIRCRVQVQGSRYREQVMGISTGNRGRGIGMGARYKL